ncbi:MAG: hypothetical protein NTY86_16230 [Deltaproteobacteria bacterium]|nr:hypothetical protein [Deltaproteobacteria bacterium]
MSSLIFYTDKHEALVVTDTLLVRKEAGLSGTIQFCSKAFFIPHINMILASTGIAGFADNWLAYFNSNLIVRDVEDLARRAPPILSEGFERYKHHFVPLFSGDLNRVTVYHFGFSLKDAKIKAYAHRSTNNFEPELRPYGMATKPPCELPQEPFDPIDIIPSLMEKQRAEQEALPEAKRLGIGGEMLALHLTNNGCNSFKIGQFKDHQQ